MAARKFSNRAGGLLPFLLGAGTFVAFLLGLKVGAAAAFLAAAAAIIGGFIFLAPPRRSLSLQTAGISREMFETVLREGVENLARVRAAADRITAPGIRQKVLGIGASVEKILAEVRKDPQDVKAARQFLSYYLEATLKIVEKYIDMTGHGDGHPAVKKSLEKAEELLDVINGAFRRQLNKLLENDVMDLDVEIALLEKTIRLEGWGGGTPGEK